MPSPAAIAQSVLPVGGTVSAGAATIARPVGNTMSIKQTSPRAVIDWNSFSVGAPNSVTFAQPTPSSAILNRVTGTSPSSIAGTLTGTGQVFLVNPNGIAITPSGTVQVGGGFVGSSLGIATPDFQAGHLTFSATGPPAHVSNAGTISAAPGGFVGLLGGTVANAGMIRVPLGRVGLGAAARATLDPTGDGFLQVILPSGATTADGHPLVDVSGTVQAPGGQIEISAATVQQAVHDAVHISGALSARSVSGHSGAITLDGGPGGDVTIDGHLVTAGGETAPGGTIIATGNNVALTGTARLNASGTTGGRILLGGDRHGGADPAQNLVPAPIRNAQATIVAAGAQLLANGTKGAGGDLVIWSDLVTSFLGHISAKGAGTAAGGFAEISSHGQLGFTGTVDLSARTGPAGTLLIDPNSVTIGTTATNIAPSSNTYTASGTSTILYTDLQTALVANNVTVAATDGITVSHAVAWSSAKTLTLNSTSMTDGSITVNGAIGNSGSGGISMSAGTTIAINSNLTTTGGAISLSVPSSSSGTDALTISNATIATNGGNLTVSTVNTAAANAMTLNNATINVGGGTGAFTGIAAAGSGLYLTGSNALTASGIGSLSISGTSANAAGASLAAGAIVSTSGPVTLSGTSNSGAGLSLAGTNTLTDLGGNLTLSGNSTSGSGAAIAGTSTIKNNSTGTLALTTTSARAIGADLSGTLAFTSSSTGSIAVNGMSTLTSATANAVGGIVLEANSALTTTGTVSVSGTAGSAANNNWGHGVVFDASARMTGASGSLTLAGTTNSTIPSTTTYTYGIYFAAGNSITASAANASISITGTNSGTSAGIYAASGTLAFANGSAGTFKVIAYGTSAISTSTANHGLWIYTGAGLQTTGTVTLTASSTYGAGAYFGNTTHNGGTTTLTMVSGNLTLTGTSSSGYGLQNLGTLAVSNGSGTTTITGTSSSTNGLYLAGNTITNSGSLTITGNATTANALYLIGTESLTDSGSALSLSGTSTTLSGLKLSTSSTLTTSGTVTLSGSAAATGYGGVWFEGGNSVTDSAGNLTITGTSTGTGDGIYVGNGTLTLQNNGGTVTILGKASGSGATNYGVAFASGANLSAGAGSIGFTASSIYGTGAANGLELLGNNTITVSAGTLSLTGNSTSGIGAYLPGTSAAAVTTLQTTGTGTLTIAGNATSGTAVDFPGYATLSNAGAALIVNADTTTPSAAVGVQFGGANTLTNTGTTLSINGDTTITYGIEFAGSPSLITNGAITLIGSASSSGIGMYISGTSAITTFTNSGGTLSLNGTNTGSGTGVSMGGTVTFSNNGKTNVVGTSTSTGAGLRLSAAVSATDSGSGITVKGTSSTGPGILFVTGSALSAGSSGTVTLTGGSSSAAGIQFSGAASLTNAGSLSITATSGTSNGVLFDPGTSLTTSGSVIVPGVSTSGVGLSFTGGTALTASSGTLTVSGTSSSAAGIAFPAAGGTVTTVAAVTLSGSSTSSDGLSFANGDILAASGGNLNVTGTSAANGTYYTGAVSLTDNGLGTLTLTSSSTGNQGMYANSGATLTTKGAVTINATTTAVNYAIDFTAGSNNITDSGGNLTINATSNGSSGVWWQDGDTPTLTNSGAGTFIVNGSGKNGVRLGNSVGMTIAGAVTFNGTSNVAGGYGFSAKGTTGTAETIKISSGATLAITGTTTASGGTSTAAGFNAAGGGGVTIANSGTFAISATGAGADTGVSFNGATTLTNTGTLSISGASTSGYGTELISGASLTTTGAMVLKGTSSSSSALYFAGGNTVTASGATLTMTGATVSGTAAELSGTIALAGGTLAIAATASGSGSGAVIDSGAGLTTNGTISLAGISATGTGLAFDGTDSVTISTTSLTLSGSSTSGNGLSLAGTLTNGGSTTLAVTGTSTTGNGLFVSGTAGLAGSGGTLALAGTNTGATGNGVVFAATAALTSVGSVSVSGQSTSGVGISFAGSNTVTDSSGSFTLTGGRSTVSATGVGLNGAVTLANSGSGTFSLSGASSTAAGVLFHSGASLTLGSGSASLSGTSVSAAGVEVTGDPTIANNGAGTLTVSGTSTSGTGYVVDAGAILAISGTGAITLSGQSTSGVGLTFGGTDTVTIASGSGAVTFTGITANGPVGLDLSSSGNTLTNNGSNVLTLSSTGGDTLGTTISAAAGVLVIGEAGTGAVTQSGGSITAGSLLVSGTSTMNFPESNLVGTLAGNVTALSFNDAQGLSIGTVQGIAGITATLSVTVLAAGTLTVASGVQVTGASPVLSATGAFVNDAGSAAVVASSGSWLIYSANPSGNTFGSLNSGNTAIWDASYAASPPASYSIAGKRYLFALQPTLSFTPGNLAKTYGVNDVTAVASDDAISGYQTAGSNAYLADSASTVYSGSPSVASSGSAGSAGVGSYPISIASGTLTALAGYALNVSATGTLTVGPAPLTIIATDQSKIYGSTLSLGSSGFTASGLLTANGDAVGSVTLASPGAAAGASAGTYAIIASTVTGNNLSNYAITYDTGTLTVSPAALTITPTAQSKIYGTTLTLGTIGFITSGLIIANGDAVSGVALASAGTPISASVGSYAITASAASGSNLFNYTITYDIGALTISPAPLTITPTAQSKIYGTTLNLGSTGFTASGLVTANGDAVSSVALASVGTPISAAVGRYAITATTASGSNLSNYGITYDTGTLTVNPAPLTITPTAQSKIYGTTLNLGSTGFTASGLVTANGDAVSSVALASVGTPISAAVGRYAITATTASGSNLSNYGITYDTGTLTVNPAPLTITPTAQSKIYGTTLNLGSTGFTASGLVTANGDAVSSVALASVGTPISASVGTYAITATTASGSNLSNYGITYDTGTLTVNPAPLTISPTAQSKIYGTTLNLGSTGFTASGLVTANGDAVSSVALASVGTPISAAVGRYAITATTASGSNLSNYGITYDTGTLTVNPAPLTITPTAQSKIYGTTLNLGSTGFTASGLVTANGDAVSSVALASVGTPISASVGTYAITATTASGSNLSNYGITYDTGTLTVNPAPLTISPTAQSKIYGTTLNLGSTGFTASGLVTANGDAVSSVALASVGTPISAAVGSYAITASTASGSNLSNYCITYDTGTLTVSPAALTITPTAQSKIYGTTLNLGSTGFTTSGLVTANGDAVSSVALASVGTPISASVGRYAITASAASGSNLSNYAITYDISTLTVNPAPLIIIPTVRSAMSRLIRAPTRVVPPALPVLIQGYCNSSLSYRTNRTLRERAEPCDGPG